MGDLTTLTDLDLGFNDFDELPSSIGKLKQLEGLDIRSSNLKRLPNCIKDLKQLKVLWMPGNELTDTPEKQAAIVKQVQEWLPYCKVYFD